MAGIAADANLVLFILGLLALRHQVMEQPKRHLKLIAGWMSSGCLPRAAWWLVLRHLASDARTDALASGSG